MKSLTAAIDGSGKTYTASMTSVNGIRVLLRDRRAREVAGDVRVDFRVLEREFAGDLAVGAAGAESALRDGRQFALRMRLRLTVAIAALDLAVAEGLAAFHDDDFVGFLEFVLGHWENCAYADFIARDGHWSRRRPRIAAHAGA